MAEPGNRIIGRHPEKIHTHHKQQCIDNARNKYPLPQPVFFYKVVGIEVRLYGNDNFFKQYLYFRLVIFIHQRANHFAFIYRLFNRRFGEVNIL